MNSTKGHRGWGGTGHAPIADVARPVAQRHADRPTGQEGGASPLRLLVVDDDRNVAEAMGVLLELRGHAVAVALSGADALALAVQFDPHVVLLDIGMAGMDGFETARRLRAVAPKHARWRLVAISGYGDEAFVAACRQAGCDHHLTKPVSRDALDALLHRLA